MFAVCMCVSCGRPVNSKSTFRVSNCKLRNRMYYNVSLDLVVANTYFKLHGHIASSLYFTAMCISLNKITLDRSTELAEGGSGARNGATCCATRGVCGVQIDTIKMANVLPSFLFGTRVYLHFVPGCINRSTSHAVADFAGFGHCVLAVVCRFRMKRAMCDALSIRLLYCLAHISIVSDTGLYNIAQSMRVLWANFSFARINRRC